MKLGIVVYGNSCRLTNVLDNIVEKGESYYNLARRTCAKVFVLFQGCSHTYYLE